MITPVSVPVKEKPTHNRWIGVNAELEYPNPMAMKKSGKLRTAEGSAKRRTLPEALRAYSFKPGQSGNPGGRPKKLTAPLEEFLARKDKKGRQYAQLLIEAMVKRAIAKSDTLVKEIFERMEGRVPNDPAQAAQFGVKVIVVDSVPRPPNDFDWEAAEREDDEND